MANIVTVELKVKDITSKTGKEKENGSIDVVTSLEGTPYLLRFTKDIYEHIQSKKHLPKRTLLISGESKLVSSKSGNPFIFVEVSDAHNLKCGSNKKEIVKNKFNENNKRKKKSVPKTWYGELEEKDFIELNAIDVDIIEEDHKNAICYIKFHQFNKYDEISPIAVKLIDGKYYLISGFTRYVYSKIFNKTVKAYVTDLSKKEFDEKYETRQQ